MSVQYVTTVKALRLQAVADRIDTGSGTASLRIYTAPRPATGEAPTGATLLATLDLPVPCGSVSGDVLTLAVPAETLISAGGSHTWARVVDRSGAAVMDLSTGVPGSGADVEIALATLAAGATLKKTAARITHS